MNAHHEQALLYVVNAGGYATVKSFEEDFEPIGALLLSDLGPDGKGYIGFKVDPDDGKPHLCLTEKGENALRPQQGSGEL